MSILRGGENGTKEYYDVVVKACNAGKSKVKGTPCLEIDFVSDSGDVIRSYNYLSKGAYKYTVEMLEEAFNWSAEERGNNFEELCGDGSVLIGLPVQITVEDEEYDGNLNPKVQWINSRGRGKLSDEDVASVFGEVRAQQKLTRRDVVAPSKPPISGHDKAAIVKAAGEGAAAAKAKEDDGPPF